MAKMSARLVQKAIFLGLVTLVNSHILDLTHPFNNKTLQWPSSESEFTVYQRIYRTGQNKWILGESYEGEVHAGTHMDSPVHMVKGTWSVDQIPNSHLVDVSAIVIDVSRKVSSNEDYQINENDVTDWISNHGPIPENSVVLFSTGWSKHYSDPRKYFGNPSLDVLNLHFPGIGISAAKWLVGNSDIVGVGIDTPSLDHGFAKVYVSHKEFFSKNIYGLENLKGLGELPPKGIRIHVSPMKIEKASGAPCRVFAQIDHSTKNANYANNLSLNVVLHILNLLFVALMLNFY